MNLIERKEYLLKKRNILCAMAAIIAATVLTGCKDKNNDSKDFLLQGTMLENCVVAEINNEKTIIKLVQHNHINNRHYHYQEIGGGVLYTDNEDCISKEIKRIPTPDFENITAYLTEDEIAKAMEGTLMDEDVVNIIFRIKGMSETEDKEVSQSR